MTIGLICEGVSESNILKDIIERYLSDDYSVNPIQPEINSKGKQSNYGGWLSVLNFCKEGKFDEVLSTNDYIVVQIDTDTSEEKHYDVKKSRADGSPKTDEELYNDICERILRDIPEKKKREYSGKILFAVCFNETECWLLPLYYTGKHECSVKNNCIYKLNQRITSHKLAQIPEKDKNSPRAINTYKAILKGFKKRKDIKDYSAYNLGFKRFIEQLDKIAQ
jgi:hypothetical protein